MALSLHRTFDLLVRQRAQLVNMIRGLLAEFGINQDGRPVPAAAAGHGHDFARAPQPAPSRVGRSQDHRAPRSQAAEARQRGHGQPDGSGWPSRCEAGSIATRRSPPPEPLATREPSTQDVQLASTRSALFIRMGASSICPCMTGLRAGPPVEALRIACTTSMPALTCPKAAYPTLSPGASGCASR